MAFSEYMNFTYAFCLQCVIAQSHAVILLYTLSFISMSAFALQVWAFFQIWRSLLLVAYSRWPPFITVCTGFSYIGPKLYNMVPKNIKDAKTIDDFKNKLKGCIWEKNPLIFQLVIKIDKEKFIDFYLFILELFESCI